MKVARKDPKVTIGGTGRTKRAEIALTREAYDALSDLYTDPKLAIVREYATNMLDAYLRLGLPFDQIIPPEIHVPNDLEPYLEFKDYGVGMPYEVVWDTFPTFFDSTKRTDNVEIGYFGLGCKSGWHYADQFTVESRYDGKRMIFGAFKDDEGFPAFRDIDTVDTDEPNGVTVRIPIEHKDFDEFIKRVNKFLRYFPLPVKITGDLDEQIDIHKPEYKYEGEFDWNGQIVHWGLRTTDIGKATVIMGGVTYPVDQWQLKNSSIYGARMDIYVPIGTVEVPPSRESLKYSDLTKNNLVELVPLLAGSIGELVTTLVEGASSLWEAYSQATKAQQVFTNEANLDVDIPVSWNNIAFDLKKPLVFPVRTTWQVDRWTNERNTAKVITKLNVEQFELTGRDISEQVVLINRDKVKYITRLRANLSGRILDSGYYGRRRARGKKVNAYVINSTKITKGIVQKVLGGFPNVHYVDEYLPPEEKKPRKVYKVRAKVFNGHDWDNIDLTANSGYYVPFANGSPVVKDADTLIRKLRQAGIITDDDPVYGIPGSMKRVRKNFIDIEKFGRKEVKKLLSNGVKGDLQRYDNFQKARYENDLVRGIAEFPKLYHELSNTEPLKSFAFLEEIAHQNYIEGLHYLVRYYGFWTPEAPKINHRLATKQFKMMYPLVAPIVHQIRRTTPDFDDIEQELIHYVKSCKRRGLTRNNSTDQSTN